jgi:hypothetical protein
MTFKGMTDVVTIGESMVLFQPMTEGELTYSPLFMKMKFHNYFENKSEENIENSV